MMEIRPFHGRDAAAVHNVHLRAFGGRRHEAHIVELLHDAGKAPISLVAVADGDPVGHILFSPVDLHGKGAKLDMVGLGPVAVLPEHQNRGIGSRLIREGLAACRAARYQAVVVLGDPRFYARFGFEQASAHGLDNEYGVDAEFMVLALHSGALDSAGGLVTYQPEFREAEQ